MFHNRVLFAAIIWYLYIKSFKSLGYGSQDCPPKFTGAHFQQNAFSCWIHSYQGGRTWQPFVGSKNGNENFCQARIYNFRVKCVVFARNRKFAKLTQWNMQYIPCNSALLAQETLFLTQKGTFLPKDLQKVRKSRQILIRDKIAYVRA